MEGVIRAVEHFRRRGIDIVIVSKRKEMAQYRFGDGVQVVLAERTDGLMVMHQARVIAPLSTVYIALASFILNPA